MTGEKLASKSSSEIGRSRPVRRREKYTRSACERCKTRKVKCSGQLPCSRCIELRVECLYHDSPSEFAKDNLPMSNRVAKRRRASNFSNPELGQLVLAMKKVCDDIETSASNYDLGRFPICSLKRTQRHIVCGNSKAVNHSPNYVHLLRLAQDILEQKGFSRLTRDRSLSKKPRPATVDGPDTTTPTEDILRAAKPILHFSHDKALQYFTTFKDHIYSAYPCINLGVAVERMSALYSTQPAGRDKFEDLGLDLIDVEIMKATFAISMTLAGEDENPLCRDLTAHLIWNIDNNMNEERGQVEDVIMATLLAIYMTLKNQPLKSWRMIRFAATTCLELGLHRQSTAEELDQASTVQSREIFSCVYDLDKRCSFFANLPWILHQKDVDAEVLSLDDQHPFLSAMLGLDRVHTEMTRYNTTTTPSSGKETGDQAELYDYRIQKLMDNVLIKGLFPPHVPDVPPPEVQNAMFSILQLRANQVRMLAYTPYLSKSCDGSSFKDQAMRGLISLAVSSLDVYLGISDASLLWRSLADRLLMGSTSCLFLAASQDPCKYGHLCRKAFHTAIDCLIKSSYQLTESELEVWCSLDDLRTLGGKIQMPPLDEQPVVETSPVSFFDSVPMFDGDLQFSTDELAQICEDTSQDPVSGFWDSTSLWESQFNEFV